jgi:hypothetical protein
MEGKIRSEEVQKPSSNECRCQETVVGVNEGALGGEEKVEGYKVLTPPAEVCGRLPFLDDEAFETRMRSAGRYHHIIG